MLGVHMYSSYAYTAINISPNFTRSPQGTPLLQERSRGLLQPGGHTRGLQWWEVWHTSRVYNRTHNIQYNHCLACPVCPKPLTTWRSLCVGLLPLLQLTQYCVQSNRRRVEVAIDGWIAHTQADKVQIRISLHLKPEEWLCGSVIWPSGSLGDLDAPLRTVKILMEGPSVLILLHYGGLQCWGLLGFSGWRCFVKSNGYTRGQVQLLAPMWMVPVPFT